MRPLVLSGTAFVGRAIVDEALLRGHEDTDLALGELKARLTSLLSAGWRA